MQESYIRGIMEYNHESWATVRDHMEKAVGQYLDDEERCRADCEATYEHVGPQEFVSAVAGATGVFHQRQTHPTYL